MEAAKSLLLNEEFTPDDDRLNYQSYVNFLLTCNVCGEAVFLKQGRERASHFSHYKDTGKNDCCLRTESNTNTRDTDSEGKKQSLEKFQKKIQKIIYEGIIKYQKISCSQLDDARHRKILLARIDQGKSLVNQFYIDINLWLSRFYDKREPIKKFALSSYHNNSSEIQRLVVSNIVHYLCLPASENILGNLLYYVFFLLNKEVNLNNDFEVVRSKVIELIHYANWEKEYKRAKESSTFNEFPGYTHPNLPPKPTKLENEVVGTGTVLFYDVIGTTPMSLRLTPSETGYKLVGLPVKLPDELLYDHARYVVSNLGSNSIGWLNNQVLSLKSQTINRVGNYTKDQMIQLFNALITGVLEGKKLAPASILESKNKLKKYLSSQPFYSNPLDQYYSFYTLAVVQIIRELETEYYTYRLTNFGDERGLAKSNLSSVLNWVRRLSYTLKTTFKDQRPTFDQIKNHLESTFKYQGCKLRVYQSKNIFFEIEANNQTVSKQSIAIVDPAIPSNKDTRWITPTKINGRCEFVHNRVFYQALKCSQLDDDIIVVAKRQLHKVCDKFIAANRNKLSGENTIAQTTKLPEMLGFSEKSKGFSGIKKTFLKFLRPFCIESEVTLGKVVNLKTGKMFNEYDASELFEKMCINWKQWNTNKQETVDLGKVTFKKPDPGKLMLEVHNTIKANPKLSTLIWDDLINTFYHLSDLSIGFKCSNGVILTPFDIYPTDIERWEHRIKVQLISIIKEGDKTRTLGIESLLQRDIYSLYSLLNRLQPGWDNNEDINKHLQALHDTLAAEGDNEAIPEILDTVEETQNHLESSSEVLEVNPEITQPIETTGEVSQVLEVIPENVEEITDPISHSSEVIEVKEETEQKLESNKIKPYLLDGSKAVSGELVFKGILGTVPCILKMTAKGRLYDIQSLPIKVNPLALAQYISYHQPKLVALTYLDRTIKKYQAMNVKLDKLREKIELISLLETLYRGLLSGIKPNAGDVLAATKTIEKYLDKAQYHSLVDDYYRFHNLGTGQFLQQVNTERYQYLVTDYGKNFRRGTGSDVNSVINWVRNCPRNLNERFGHKAAEIDEIKCYLEKSFNDRFSKNVQVVIYERGQKFLEIYHKGELEIKQLISIVSPSTDKKKTNLISTDTNFKPEYGTDNEFQQFLQCSEYESALIFSTRQQLIKMVQKYVRSNYLILTGEGKVFKETRITQLIGLDQCNTRYGGVIKTFLKYVRPYLDQASQNVGKGELISLDTLKTYSEKDAYELVGEMTNQWKNWKHKDQETIKLGESIIKKPDPGTLMLAVNAAIYQNPHHDQIIWRDIIDIFYQLSEYPLGFRASNGVVLTPHSFYESGVIRHTHRIKLQLIDLLRKEQKTKQDKAHNSLKQASTTEEKQKAMEEIELVKVTNPGSIEAWLQQPIKKLYDNLESLDPQWEINLANPDILKHLEAMHDALVLATQAEAND
ncbi:hypothetical protein QUB70_20240 [Microcoleus sp. A003_D6]|uniref:competence protein CoiA family protein n=1 Tax=Microcoleus sp. A003_D6 TaxID=3055266 RepID=UPI002FD62428